MTNVENEAQAIELTTEEWIATRKEAGLKIDPATAEVTWKWAQVLDPYGVNPNLPEECDQVGRVWFVRSPGSDVWVCEYDLPEATITALKERNPREIEIWPFDDI